MRQLFWKEWHEQSWKLGFGCIVLGALALIGLRSRILADETMMMWVCFLGILLLPILSATGLVPAERGEGTMESLLALPVKGSRVFCAKGVMGILLCVGPMVTAMVISLAVAGGREMPVFSMVAFYVASTLTMLFLLVWMMALTIRLPSETRAALLSVGIMILWMLATQGLAYPSVPKEAMVVSPFALVYQVSRSPEASDLYKQYAVPVETSWVILAVVVQLLIAAFLWVIASRRIASEEGGR